MNRFIDRVWHDNEAFIFHVTGHGVKIVCTMVCLKLIYIISYLMFSEKPKIVEYMEYLSNFGLLAIFFVLVIFDIYDVYIVKKYKRWGVQ
jgi:hypothetical protein